MSEAAQMLHDSPGRHDAEIEVRVGSGHGTPDRTFIQRHVFRVNNLAKSVDRDRGAGLEPANPVELIGPEVLVGGNVPPKAPGMAEALRFRQVRFAASDLSKQPAVLERNRRLGSQQPEDAQPG